MTMTETKLTGEVSKVDRSIDRLKTCPLLLRVFCNKNRHHLAKDYEQGRTPENELQIYTWMDATLGEITQLIKEVNPDSRRRGIQFSFSTVSADDSHNRYYLSDIGKTENGQRRADDQIQLANKRFRVGDYLDVAIIHRRPEPPAQNQRRDRLPQQSSEDNNNNNNYNNNNNNNKRRGGGPGNDRNGGGPVRSAPRNEHRDRPY